MQYLPALNLPFDYKILCCHTIDDNARILLVGKLTGKAEIVEYVTYQNNAATGECFWGHYFRDFDDAKTDYTNRTNRTH